MKEFSFSWKTLWRCSNWMLLYLLRGFFIVSYFLWMTDLIALLNHAGYLLSQTILSWGIKLLSIFVIMLLKIETFLLIWVLRKALFQLKLTIPYLIRSVFSCLLCRISGGYGSVKYIGKWNFSSTIGWWQLGCSDGWTPNLTTKLGYFVKLNSFLLEEDSSFVNYSTYTKLSCHICNRNVFEKVLSWLLQIFDFALKSPMTTVKEGFFRVSRVISKLTINAWKPVWFWLGDLYRVIKLQI